MLQIFGLIALCVKKKELVIDKLLFLNVVLRLILLSLSLFVAYA